MSGPAADLRQQFLDGMSQAACTVNVVTTDGPAGRAGVTVSAMSAVSADTPRPTLLVCVHHLASAASAILDNGVFCVNVLRDDQSFISDVFAGRHDTERPDRFDCARWTHQVTGAPRVVDPLVAFDCRLVSSDRIGTHHVFFGEIEDIFAAPHGSPLIYANRAYGAAARIEPPLAGPPDSASQARDLAVGCFHTFGPYVLPGLVRSLREVLPECRVTLVEGDQRRLQEGLLAGEIEIALLYDLDLPDEIEREPLASLEPYVLLAAGHPLAGRASLSPAELAAEPMVLLSTPPSPEYVLAIFARAGVTPDIAFESTSFEMVRGLVGHGHGYALLATKPASAMTYDGRALVSRPLDAPPAPTRMILAWRRGATLCPAAAAFARGCRARFELEELSA